MCIRDSTYTEGVSSDLLRVEELYDEQYVLLVPDRHWQAKDTEISWAAAAELPLILLEPDMQNRRILDNIFDEAGAHPSVVAETNGLMAAIAMALEGMGATVLPRVLVDAIGVFQGATLLPLIEPAVEKSVSLVTPLRAQSIPVVDALRRSVMKL